MQKVVHDEAVHHVVLRCSIVAARGVLDGTVLGASNVVARHHFVVDALVAVGAAGEEMVVDDVQDDAETEAINGRHHSAELERARGAIDGVVAGVGALRDAEEDGVVAPVEAVDLGGRHHSRLLVLAVARKRRQRGGVRLRPVTHQLRHATEIVDGEEVHVGEARLGKRGQVSRARRLGLESDVLSARLRRHVFRQHRKVAHVQLVDGGIRVMLEVGFSEVIPAGGEQVGGVNVGDLRALPVSGSRAAGGVSRHRSLDVISGGAEDRDTVHVVSTNQGGRPLRTPHPVLPATHGHALLRTAARSVVHQQLH
mmetsp:Transcript_7290/g.13176  ORF Transcript_7290/g.13176 Transcript_7290/m.13176 type:complete len:311 (+) Transcript_7290:1331-2263(+)